MFRGARTSARAREFRSFLFGATATVALVLAVGLTPLGDALFASTRTGTPAQATALAADDRAASPPRTASTPTTTAPVTTAPVTTAPVTTAPAMSLPGAPPGLAPVYSRIPATNKVIFLGIDDGIVRDPAVLQLLAAEHVPFTMFLVQGEAHAGVDYWRAAQAAGGVVESHTITHPDLTKVGAAQLQREVCGTLDDYQSLFGRRPTLFRPPFGTYNTAVQSAAASCGYKAIILWKASTNDGRFDLQEGPLLHPGDIVLMHWRTDLYQNLLKVLEVCRQQGFTVARLEDYVR